MAWCPLETADALELGSRDCSVSLTNYSPVIVIALLPYIFPASFWYIQGIVPISSCRRGIMVASGALLGIPHPMVPRVVD